MPICLHKTRVVVATAHCIGTSTFLNADVQQQDSEALGLRDQLLSCNADCELEEQQSIVAAHPCCHGSCTGGCAVCIFKVSQRRCHMLKEQTTAFCWNPWGHGGCGYRECPVCPSHESLRYRNFFPGGAAAPPGYPAPQSLASFWMSARFTPLCEVHPRR